MVTVVGVVLCLALAASASAALPAPFALTAPAEGARMATRAPALTWERSAGALRYEVQIDGGDFLAQSGTVGVADCAAACSFSPPAPLYTGPHRWTVIASNADGVTEAVGAFTVDVPPAILAIEVGPGGGVHGIMGPPVSVIHGTECPHARVRSDDPWPRYEQFKLDGQPFDPAIPWSKASNCNLAAVPHTIEATVTDQLGHSTTAGTTFRTDLVRPVVRIEGPTRLVQGTTATFRAVADPSTVVEPVHHRWLSQQALPLDPACACRARDGAVLTVPVTFTGARLELRVDDAEGDGGGPPPLDVIAGPKPPRGTIAIQLDRHSHRRRMTVHVVWPPGAITVTLSEGGRTRTFGVSRTIPWTLSGTGRRAVRARFDWPLPARASTARVTVHKRGSLNPRT